MINTFQVYPGIVLYHRTGFECVVKIANGAIYKSEDFNLMIANCLMRKHTLNVNYRGVTYEPQAIVALGWVRVGRLTVGLKN